jgi:hypothetical protein
MKLEHSEFDIFLQENDIYEFNSSKLEFQASHLMNIRRKSLLYKCQNPKYEKCRRKTNSLKLQVSLKLPIPLFNEINQENTSFQQQNSMLAHE